MSWKIVYEILDDPDLFGELQDYKAENGDLTAATARYFVMEHIIQDSDGIDWQYVAEHLNKEEH